jgi:hypothetical protein
MTNLLKNLDPIYNDAPEPWQLGFQDGASPGFTGIVELHNEIFFFLTVICVGVFFMMFSILVAFTSNKAKIVHKYLNHGTLKCLCKKLIWKELNTITVRALRPKEGLNQYSNKFKVSVSARQYSTNVENGARNQKPERTYDNTLEDKFNIIKQNRKLSGIYKFTNKINGKIYIGSSIDLGKRFTNYFNANYISGAKNKFSISRALIK